MKIYIVFYYNECTKVWNVGNAYLDRASADEEAESYGGYVLTRVVL